MAQSSVYLVIMAGGSGTRFWPVSRVNKPKQFLPLAGTNESLIQATARRVLPLSTKEKVLVVANAAQQKLISEHVPFATCIVEPQARNTAPAIALAASWIAKHDPQAVMVVLPADHAVRDEALLVKILKEAVELAEKQPALVTVGVKPRFPHTGYGYIRSGLKLQGRAHTVARFYEKPNAERAKTYFESGDYYWNSGMFVWKASTILESIAEEMPELSAAFSKYSSVIGTPEEATTLREVYAQAEAISIDFGVLEHARNCAVIAAEDFGWNDVGSWDAWAEHFSPDSRGNHLQGDAIVVDSNNCIVKGDTRLVALLGAQDLVVIDSGDAVLVCPRSRVQDVRKVVEELQGRNRRELL